MNILAEIVVLSVIVVTNTVPEVTIYRGEPGSTIGSAVTMTLEEFTSDQNRALYFLRGNAEVKETTRTNIVQRTTLAEINCRYVEKVIHMKPFFEHERERTNEWVWTLIPCDEHDPDRRSFPVNGSEDCVTNIIGTVEKPIQEGGEK